MNRDSIFAPYDWTIKSHISYIHFYWEWLCNGRCISTRLIKTQITVEQTAHFSLLSGKKLSKITPGPFHREIGHHYLWPWTEHCYLTPFWKAQQWLHLRPSYTKCPWGFGWWPCLSGVYVFVRLIKKLALLITQIFCLINEVGYCISWCKKIWEINSENNMKPTASFNWIKSQSCCQQSWAVKRNNGIIS